MLFRMGVTAEEIKTMGRWFSDVYRIYCRLSKERLLELSEKMGSARATQFVNGARGFFDTLLEVEPVEARPAGGGSGSSVPSEGRGDAEDERSDCMADDAAAAAARARWTSTSSTTRKSHSTTGARRSSPSGATRATELG